MIKINDYPKYCVSPKQRERYDRKQEYLRIKKKDGLVVARKVYQKEKIKPVDLALVIPLLKLFVKRVNSE